MAMQKIKWRQSLVAVIFCTFISAAMAAESVPTTERGGKYPAYPTANYGKDPTQAALIKKGEYLVKAGDCIACHTDGPDGKPFAGGLPIKTPFGTIFSTNITPDKETGIGNWTDKQFIDALRHGKTPDGSYYFPVFPYIYFNKLSDQDALAIKAYLHAIPAVQQQNKPLDMPIPFRWRFGQIAWRLLFFKDEPFQPDPRQSAEWNRGKYLVTGLGHCGMCHSPLNFLGAEKKEYYLTGGFVDGFYAPNISSTNLANTPVQDVVNVFLKDKLIGGGDVQGPMLEVNHDSLVHLDRADLDAIVVYLKTVKSKTPPKPKSATQVSLKVGEKVYNQYCQGCHTTGAGGAPKMGDVNAWAPIIKLGLNQLYTNAIAGIGGMPPKGTCASCSTAEIQSAVQYIVSKSQGAAGAVSAAAAPVTVDPTSIAKGKQIYDKICSACHNNGLLGAPKIRDKAAWAPLIDEGMPQLFQRAIGGYHNHPPKGACNECSDADVIAAVKYMVQESKSDGDYQLW